MQSLFDFIVKPVNNKRYNNTTNIEGLEFITSTSQEDHKFSNREAVVINVPLGYVGNIKKGDTLLVHHNVFKYYYDMKGRQKSGSGGPDGDNNCGGCNGCARWSDHCG